MKGKRGHSKRSSYLSVKLGLASIVILSVVFGLYSYFSWRDLTSTIDEQYRAKATSIITTVNAAIDNKVNFNDKDYIQQLCDNLAKINPDVLKVSIYAKQKDGKVVRMFSSDHSQIGKEADIDDAAPIKNHHVTWSETFDANGSHIVEILAPLYLNGKPKASFGVYMDLKPKDIATKQYTSRALIYAFVTFLAMAILLYAVIRKELFKPLNLITEGARELAIGNFNKRISLRRNDELGELAQRFDLMAEALQLKEEKKQVEEELVCSLDRLKRIFEEVVIALSSTAEKRDPYTAGHQQRVARIACAIATEMGLTIEQIEGIHVAGIMHDIGKLSTPNEILTKPGKLSDVEFSLVKDHAQHGFDILETIEFPWPVAQIVLQHHERMDGSGYPNGLSGEDILLEARILSVADVVEAMASHRPYRAALGADKALEEIVANKGTLYDPQVVDACVNVLNEEWFKQEYGLNNRIA